MINFCLAGRVQPKKKESEDEVLPKKYYAVAQSRETVNAMKFCERAAVNAYGDANLLAVLPILAKQLKAELLLGNIVDLGDLGTFSLTLKSKGVDSKDHYNPRVNIKEVNFHWEPAWNSKRFLQEADFHQTSSRADGREARRLSKINPLESQDE
ncbi:MAG: hypothetical protein Q4A08_04350 [Bacteroidales bacterium]|nr:hypothetical protein [Bacteroidales bacterium]